MTTANEPRGLDSGWIAVPVLSLQGGGSVYTLWLPVSALGLKEGGRPWLRPTKKPPKGHQQRQQWWSCCGLQGQLLLGLQTSGSRLGKELKFRVTASVWDLVARDQPSKFLPMSLPIDSSSLGNVGRGLALGAVDLGQPNWSSYGYIEYICDRVSSPKEA